MNKHKKIHSIDKDYKCAKCNYQFTQKVHAKKHIMRFHPNEPMEEILLQKMGVPVTESAV